MTGHEKWVTTPRTKDQADRMVAYVEGYILALYDVQRDVDEIDLRLRVSDDDDVARSLSAVQAKIYVSLKEARTSLRMWKGLQDEQSGTDATGD